MGGVYCRILSGKGKSTLKDLEENKAEKTEDTNLFLVQPQMIA